MPNKNYSNDSWIINFFAAVYLNLCTGNSVFWCKCLTNFSRHHEIQWNKIDILLRDFIQIDRNESSLEKIDNLDSQWRQALRIPFVTYNIVLLCT